MATADRAALHTGLQQLNLTCTDQQINQLLEYGQLLHKWNQTHNLISAQDNGQLIKRHILDSLSLTNYISSYYSANPDNSILDFGTGAGLPGLPLAVLHPHYNFTLLDSHQKKIAFLQYCKTQLKLQNIKPLCQRIESHQILHPLIITRAASEITQLINLILPCLTENGHILAMLGKQPAKTDLEHIKTRVKAYWIDKLQFSFNTGQRHVLVARRSNQPGADKDQTLL